MKPRLLLVLALLGGLAVLLDLPELLVPATPLAFLTMTQDRHRVFFPWLRRGVEAVAVAGIFLMPPDLVMVAARTGYEAGATVAEQDRRAEGRPPRAPEPAPHLPEGVQRLLTVFTGIWLAVWILHRFQKQETRARAFKDQALRAKLAPHFIFNTLNTLKAQIEQDPHAASATTDRLASLFRQVVQVADQPTIPLKQELAFVEAYLGIEQARLGDRLTVVMDIPEDLDDRPVPPLSLQVLVENAIKHGIAPFEQPGTVTIEAEAVPEGLRLNVSDTGFGSATQPGTGTALATLRQRLARPEDLGWERLPSGFKASLLWRPK